MFIDAILKGEHAIWFPREYIQSYSWYKVLSPYCDGRPIFVKKYVNCFELQQSALLVNMDGSTFAAPDFVQGTFLATR